MPLSISVIMGVRNGLPYLEQALQSLWEQTYTNYEIIVYDGLSTDKTVELLKKNADKIKFWASEADSGPGEAINKAFAKATGDIVAVMNSDDRFAYPELFADIVREFEADTQLGAVLGHVEYRIRETDALYGINRCSKSKQLFRITAFLIGAFIRRDLAPTPLLDPKYAFADDYDLFCNLLAKKKIKAVFRDRVHSLMRFGGRSDLVKNDFVMFKEYLGVRIKYFGLIPAFAVSLPRFPNILFRRMGLPAVGWWIRRIKSAFKTS